MNKSIISLFVGLILGIILIAIWSQFVDVSIVREHIESVNWKFVLWSGLSYIAAYFVRSIRWNYLLSNEKKISYMKTYCYSLSGNLINYLIPIRAGELAKPFFLLKNDGINISKSLPTVIIDKFFDTIGIFLVLLLIPILHINISKAMLMLIILLILIFIIGLLILIIAGTKPKFLTKMIELLFFWAPEKIKSKIMDGISSFLSGISILNTNRRMILPLSLLTFLGVLLDAMYFYLVFISFGVEISFVIILFGYTLINLSYALPQTPAQIGTNEWMMAVIFSAGFGLDKNLSAAIMAFAHIFTAIILIVSGFIALSYTGNSLIEIFIKRSNSKNE